MPRSAASESATFLPTARPRPAFSNASTRSGPLRGRGGRRWRRCLFGSAFYVVICGSAAFCLIALLHLSGYRAGSRDYGFSRQSQANIGTLGSAGNGSATLDALEDEVDPTNSSAAGAIRPLPPHRWDPFIQDALPLTHLTPRACYFPPWTFFTVCAPAETPEDVARHGPWVRVPRDIGHKASRSYQELYYRRALSLDTPPLRGRAITGVKVIEDEEAKKPGILDELKRDGWEPTGDNLRADVWPFKDRLPSAHLWITRAAEVDGRAVAPINEVDVLWGGRDEVEPWWGFERLEGGSVPIYGGEADPARVRTEIVVRRTSSTAQIQAAPSKLRFSGDGKFRVLQVADLHFSTSKGDCRDVGRFKKQCEDQGADKATMEWIKSALRRTEPSLVVLTGEQLNGQGTTWDQLSVLLKVGHLIGDAGIPWTAVFGNHDSQDGLPRKEQFTILQSMPYFLGVMGPGGENRTDEEGGEMGIGNFVVPLYAPEGGQDDQLFNLFFLDSHALAGGSVKHAWDKVTGGEDEYDWIKPSQIDWFVRTAEGIQAILRPFKASSSSTDADSTFHLWGGEDEQDRKANSTSVSNSTQLETTKEEEDLPEDADDRRLVARQRERPSSAGDAVDQTLRRPSAMLFQHIPLPEAYSAADTNSATGAEKVYGHRLEGTGSPKHNSGFFENGILRVTESGGAMAGSGRVTSAVENVPMVKVVVNGHCHVTDECRRVSGVWHCFGGGSSFAGYGKDGFERRVRVFELADYGEKITTWKVLDPQSGESADKDQETKERWEEVVLVGAEP